MTFEQPAECGVRVFLGAHPLYLIGLATVQKNQPCLLDPENPVQFHQTVTIIIHASPFYALDILYISKTRIKMHYLLKSSLSMVLLLLTFKQWQS